MRYICINDNFEPLYGVKSKLNEEYKARISIKYRYVMLKSDNDNYTDVDIQIFSKHFMELRLYKIKKLKNIFILFLDLMESQEFLNRIYSDQ
jgi:hypothetical protein